MPSVPKGRRKARISSFNCGLGFSGISESQSEHFRYFILQVQEAPRIDGNAQIDRFSNYRYRPGSRWCVNHLDGSAISLSVRCVQDSQEIASVIPEMNSFSGHVGALVQNQDWGSAGSFEARHVQQECGESFVRLVRRRCRYAPSDNGAFVVAVEQSAGIPDHYHFFDWEKVIELLLAWDQAFAGIEVCTSSVLFDAFQESADGDSADVHRGIRMAYDEGVGEVDRKGSRLAASVFAAEAEADICACEPIDHVLVRHEERSPFRIEFEREEEAGADGRFGFGVCRYSRRQVEELFGDVHARHDAS